MLRFSRELIAFRKGQPNVRRASFLTGEPNGGSELPDVRWYGADGQPANWSTTCHSLLCVFGTTGLEDTLKRDIMIFMHAGGESQTFCVPILAQSRKWRLLVNTAAQAPNDIHPEAEGPLMPPGRKLVLPHHTLVCYVAE
jgi:isoamylase